MIRLQTYAAFSLLATASAVYYAFSSREQFYPAMVYLSTSKICFVLLLNTGLVAMCVAWQLVKRLFLGSLREAEVERLNEQSWREVVEILFAVTIFRQDFSVSFLAMVAALLLVKALHWLAQKRVEYIETTPSVPMLSHIRIVSFMAFLLIVDCLFLSNSLRSLIDKREASVAIFFSFEYMILASSTVSTFVKYVFYISDMLMEGQWEKKAVYTFYLELISDLVHLSLYMLFFIAIFLNYGVPLHLIRELYETFRNFKIRVADYVRYRKITSNMNERFPDATAEELNASDATCIICREEMTTAKKLLCGHLFHVHCLRSWLERQHTCPTCRAPIIPPDNGRAASARQHGAQPGVQPGTGTPASEGAVGDNMSRRQAKLEAAAAAASLYGRSFAYPPANILNRSGPSQSTSSTPQFEASSSNQSQKDQELQFQNTSDGFTPLPFNAHGAMDSGTITRDLENSLQRAQENFIKSQIEMASSGNVGRANASAESSQNDGYDPLKDPRRRPKSNDPGWKYAYYVEPGKRDLIQCALCPRKIKGGIIRVKQHLAGGSTEILVCPKTTPEIQKEMKAALDAGKTKRDIPVYDDSEEGDGEEDTVEVIESSRAGSSSSSRSTSKRKESASKPPTAPSSKKPINALLRRTPQEVVAERHAKGLYQRTINVSMKPKEERDAVCIEIAKCFYECGVPFNVANSRQFEIAVESIAQYGSGFKPPSFHELREPLLAKCVKEIDGDKKRHEDAWTQYGCTLMSDGWTDRRGRQLINFLVNSPVGTFFLESVDASNESHDAMMLADLLDQRIEKIGRDKVVQIVTDNGANYKAAGRYLVERTPTLFWTPCAAHCLDLMLEDIGKLKDFVKPITRARHVTTFIYRHGRILNEMRKFTKGMDLVRMAATRFATAFLTLRSLHKHKDALRALFSGDVFTRSKVAKTEAGKKVYGIIFSTQFWNSVEDCLRASLPLLVVLRLVDGDEKPALPEVAAAMNIAKQKISASFSTQNKKACLNRIMKIVENRWVKQMDTPLYGAALYLNPGKFYKMKQSDDDGYVGELRGCFNDVLVKMVTDDDLRDKIDGQAVLYENQRESFANPMAIRNAQTRSPVDWWLAYGGRTIELYKFARRIVSLCASSSGCERNWSTFEFMHTKKRNRLEHERLSNLVYVSYNRKMAARFQKMREEGKNFDPLVLEDFDWDNEWVDPLANSAPIGGDPLFTWDHVDQAAGASTQLQGRNFPRRAHGSHVSRIVQDEDEHDTDVGEENENDDDFVLDDLDMDDDEATNNGGNGEEERNDDIGLDELDDGF